MARCLLALNAIMAVEHKLRLEGTRLFSNICFEIKTCSVMEMLKRGERAREREERGAER